MFVSLVLAALASDPKVSAAKPGDSASATSVTATTVAGLTPAQLAAPGERAWATFPTTIGGKAITATVKCINGGACTVYDGNKAIGTASILKVHDEGFILNSSLSSGGIGVTVKASWKPAENLRSVVQPSP